MEKEDILESLANAQMEINISNINASNQIVLNDLRLLELLHMYPFLLSKALTPHGDADYEEWGWNQVSELLNLSYEGMQLGAPFSVEELQWRWQILKPVCASLVNACGKIPDSLWYIISEIHNLMTNKLPVTRQAFTPTQMLILDQVPLMEHLSVAHQNRLEVEVMDAILKYEQEIHCGKEALTREAKTIVKTQYDEFLENVRVKEMPTPVASDAPHISSKAPFIINNNPNSIIIIRSVRSLDELPEPETTQTPLVTIPSSLIKTEPPETEPVREEPVEFSIKKEQVENVLLHYVPIKSAKYYIKKVQVRLKRLHLTEYMKSQLRFK